MAWKPPGAEAGKPRAVFWASYDSKGSSRTAHSTADQPHATAIDLNMSRKLWGLSSTISFSRAHEEEGEMVTLPLS